MRASLIAHPGRAASYELQALKCTELRSGAIPPGLALPFRVHQISTVWRDSAITVTNNQPELIEKLAEGISNLTSSEDWQHYLDFQSRFHLQETDESSQQCFAWSVLQ
jgi:hypothetical protein